MRKHAYPRKLYAQLGDWQGRIDQLIHHIEQADPGTRRELEQQIEDLRAKRSAARRKLDQLERHNRSGRGRLLWALRRLVPGMR